MQKYLCKLRVDAKKILIAPFANITMYDKVSKSNGSFICVSSGDVHKNLDKLILAWVVLAQQGLYPKLFLTFHSAAYPKLSMMLDTHVEKYGLLIDNLGEIDASYINTIYQNGATLIFPSLTESLGLPLIEARDSGVDVIASELDYVRDVIEPVQTFDPNSSISIARAVKRYLGISDSLPSLWDISELNEQLFKS
jgi:glycosyltransferase involved in cell wall biosynthesis